MATFEIFSLARTLSNMNTNRIGMKLLVATTVGALIAGSGASAMAAPAVNKPTKPTHSKVVLTSVDIKRHSPIDFTNIDPAATKLPSIRLSARVKDSGKALPSSTVVAVTLAQYTKKVRGQKVAPAIVTPAAVGLVLKKGKTSKSFSGAFTFTSDQVAAIRADLTKPGNEGKSISLCLSTAAVTNPLTTPATDLQAAPAKKLTKRLDNGQGTIAVGDCVRLIAKASATNTAPPATTTSPRTTTPTTDTAPPATTTSPTTATPITDTAPPATTTTTTTTTTVVPTAAVIVKAVDHRSKLHVNVNPNKGRGYWRFQVQRKKSSGAWKSLSTYRTHGTKETRTLDLKRGTYRVVVLPKYGHQGSTSVEVSLKR